MQNEIANKTLLEIKKGKLITENASYRKRRNQHNDDILKLNVEKLHNNKIIELDTNIANNDLELFEIENEIPRQTSKILILENAIKVLTRNIRDLTTEKDNAISKRTNAFNNLNKQLVSYELKELIEDLEILKNTQRYYEDKLEQFKKVNKIEFGNLKVKEDDYRQHNLIANYEDDNKQKYMYYNVTNTELTTKLDEICAAIDNTAEYCHTRTYNNVCQLDIIDNKITGNTNTILYNDECLKIKPFMNKLPYTKTKK